MLRSVQAAGNIVGNAPIDHLINCAGVMGGSRQQLGNMDYCRLGTGFRYQHHGAAARHREIRR